MTTEDTGLIATREMRRLRDFQRDTARHAFRRMFTAADATPRFLVADEVGLGKTLVARGVIAQTIDHLRAHGDDRIDIVYVASNAAIAAQNVRKLKIEGIDVQHRAGRLSLLPFRVCELDQREVNVIALTPGTSLDLRGSSGVFRERAAVYRALQSIWGAAFMDTMGAARTCFWGISEKYGSQVARRRLLAEAHDLGTLHEPMRSEVRTMMRERDLARRELGLTTLREEFVELKAAFARQRPSFPREISVRRQRFIRDMREVLSSAGVHALRPDLVILDEFQRFRNLIRVEDPAQVDKRGEPEGDPFAGQLARQIFAYWHEEHGRSTRVLMLSATPYAMHTTSEEAAAGDDRHYEDFLNTYRFLVDGDASAVSRLQKRLADLRTAIYDARFAGAQPAKDAAAAVSTQLLKVMARTERLASTKDRNGMLTTVPAKIRVPTAASIRQYVDVDAIARHVGAGDPVDFWKSAPYPMSFLGGLKYDITQRITKKLAPPRDPSLYKLLVASTALMEWESVRQYKELAAQNPRLEMLWRQVLDTEAWRLLWLPPSVAYYRAGGDFEEPWAQAFTKRLVFSAWNVVPTAISTLTSYEVERRTQPEPGLSRSRKSVHYDDTSNSRHTVHLRPPDLQSLTQLALIMPSHELAAPTDALAISRELSIRAGRLPTMGAVLTEAQRRVRRLVAPIVRGRARSRAADTVLWYWLIPVLLDHFAGQPRASADWWSKHTDSAAGLRDQMTRLRALTSSMEDYDLPDVPEDLEEVLALIGLASPAMCALRSVRETWPTATAEQQSKAASGIAWGFRSLFNGFEATHLIEQEDTRLGSSAYWLKALRYCARGNLQATMDEYLHVFSEWRGYVDPGDLAEATVDVISALSLRSAVYSVRVNEVDGVAFKDKNMRGRYAVRFGDQRSEEGGEDRAEAVALAFNSPFWPYVLSSTSIGQEGLDFHLYCHAIMHWNLPGNPVDLEQREGRIHRYKGHAVRKNIGQAIGLPPHGPVWEQAFKEAERYRAPGDPEIVPYWVFQPHDVDTRGLAKIERHLPIIPFTRESSRISDLLASTAHYRIAFGQPRQEELLTYVLRDLPLELVEELREVRVDLSPARRRA